MLKVGSIILTVWSSINFLLAAMILISIIFFKNNAPIMFIVFEESEIAELDVKVVSSIKSLAILFNSCAASLSLLTILVIWTSLINGQRWAFWALLITIGLVQIMGFIADSAIANKTLGASMGLTVIYLVGIAMAGYGLVKR